MKDRRTGKVKRLLVPMKLSKVWCASLAFSTGRRTERAGSSGANHRRWVPASMIALAASAASMAARSPTLQPMTLAQVMDAGAAGTGCSWSLPADRRIRFAAAHDRAAIRLDGETVVLSPAPHARELFPFTFAEWRAGELTVGVRQLGPSRMLSTESHTSRATLRIVIRGATSLIPGVMSCGS
jgi:hypothetical protein